MADQYPQELRSAWADLAASYGSAIWRCVDARRDVALAHPDRRGEPEAVLARAIAWKDALGARLIAAREALRAAENAYYAEESEI